MHKFSPYEVLGVARDASDADIKQAHRRLARRFHPDVSKEENAEEMFKLVQRAYDILSDPDRRAHFDKTGEENIEDPMVGVRDLLASALKTTLIRTLDMPWVNIVNVAHMVLDEMRDTINKQLEETREAIQKMERHRGRVQNKTGHNMYEAIVDAQLERARQMMARHPKMIEEIRGAHKLLKEYESQEQEQPSASKIASIFLLR